MRFHQAIWRTVVSAVTVVGIAVALATSPGVKVINLFATGGACAAVIAANLHLVQDRAAPPRAVLLRRATAGAVLVGSAVLGCYGLSRSIGVFLLPTVAGLTATHPLVLAWLTGREDRAGSGSAKGALVESVVNQEFAGWTDTDLYSVWCKSSAVVARTAEIDRAATVAQARQHLLAELERRYPAKTTAWLSSGAALAGEPPRFLVAEDQ